MIFNRKYKYFYKYLLDFKIKKAFNNSYYASQGICVVDDSMYITYYDTGYNSCNSKGYGRNDLSNSILSIQDADETKTLELNHKGHVGAIGYSKLYNKLYISAPFGKINIYNISKINNCSCRDVILEDGIYDLKEDGLNTVSYMYVDCDNLFVGEFKSNKKNTLLYKYSMYDDEKIVLIDRYVIPFKNIQGICKIMFNGVEYFLFSCSFGRFSSSKLYITTLMNKKFNIIKCINMPPMSEQIVVDSNNNLMICFESDCIKYSKGLDRKGKCITKIENIVCFDICSLINNIKYDKCKR